MAQPVIGVILAGGRAERMGGGDKALRAIAGTTILARVIGRVRPQVDHLVINANGDPARFAVFNLPVIADAVPGFAGPLAGVLAGMAWSSTHGAGVIVTVAGDGPFVPRDLVARLQAARVRDDAEIVLAASGGQHYPVVGLWPVSLHADLRKALVDEDVHKVETWANRHRVAVVDFPADPIDPFFNANTPEQLAEAERLAQRYPDI